ncbi:hypothetical protein VP01_1598g4 [Puccinia sorghi]|uniref:Uncharacterized protein n=1 Tax=Puccinia sorghi TaxID=27349 RepID=A0A0L6VHK0_9BASI|nr:hypothetical protein VP01_1598g4 [Puccinia sorghi]
MCQKIYICKHVELGSLARACCMSMAYKSLDEHLLENSWKEMRIKRIHILYSRPTKMVTCLRSNVVNWLKILHSMTHYTNRMTFGGCFHGTHMKYMASQVKLRMILVVTCVDFKLKNQPDLLPNSSCYMNKLENEVIHAQRLNFCLEMIITDFSYGHHFMTLIFLCYDHIENVKKSLVSEPPSISQSNSIRTAKTIIDITQKLNKTNTTLPNKKKKPTQTFPYLVAGGSLKQPHTLELGRPTKDPLKVNPLFSSLEDELLPLTLSPKPVFKSLNATVSSFCLWVLFNDIEETPLPTAEILMTALSKNFSAESQHALHNQTYSFTWLFLKALCNQFTKELLNLCTTYSQHTKRYQLSIGPTLVILENEDAKKKKKNEKKQKMKNLAHIKDRSKVIGIIYMYNNINFSFQNSRNLNYVFFKFFFWRSKSGCEIGEIKGLILGLENPLHLITKNHCWFGTYITSKQNSLNDKP